MKKSTALIALIALAVAIVGVIIALAAYLNRKKCLCDDLDIDLEDEEYEDLPYYTADFDEETPAADEQPAQPEETPAE